MNHVYLLVSLWPSRSPNLNVSDFSFDGFMKNLVYNTCKHTITKIEQAAATIREKTICLLRCY